MSATLGGCALAQWGAGGAGLGLLGVAIGAVAGARRLGIAPARRDGGSLADALSIVAANLRLALTLAVLVVLAAALRSLGPDYSAARIGQRICDAATVAIAVVNVAALGLALGALGFDAYPYVLPHAPLEIPGFALAFLAYIEERQEGITLRRALVLFACCAGLLICGALVEGLVTGALA